jgi:hypothetical protein
MHIDPDTLAEILEAMKSAAARLRSSDQCRFSNNRAAAELDHARAALIEATEEPATDETRSNGPHQRATP